MVLSESADSRISKWRQKLILLIMETNQKWGFLRETDEKAKEEGIDKVTGLHRTGLDKYLAVIFPDAQWLHNKKLVVNGGKRNIFPDYRCDELKLIIEFDGLTHYDNYNVIRKDKEKDKLIAALGYKLIRIPYFIQLTNEVIKILFGVEVQESMFDPNIASMYMRSKNAPKHLCPEGVQRMAEDFLRFPQQYDVNVRTLEESENNTGVDTGVTKLKECFQSLKHRCKFYWEKVDNSCPASPIFKCKVLQDETTRLAKCNKIKNVYCQLHPNAKMYYSDDCIWTNPAEMQNCPFFKEKEM